ncbi:hypothetical protein [Pedobacter nyackensis]|uniref:Uncharacterized protein n=1 Tax=Pedobacter nyackensis TaxID=475255 RepID=A0A1W2EKD0_9SPHI|nr:hypothetical protein [Pedobacter nyackensis]SMD10075.1 hypothetical protein SAMN04488101_11330 [Pedobacter nyackensis]
MKTKENMTAERSPEIKGDTFTTGNYHQQQVDGEDQTVLVDPAITSETDELDPAFTDQVPPRDPEDDDDDQDDEDDEEFPVEEDLEGDDFDLNHDADDDLSLNIDDDDDDLI